MPVGVAVTGDKVGKCCGVCRNSVDDLSYLLLLNNVNYLLCCTEELTSGYWCMFFLSEVNGQFGDIREYQLNSTFLIV